MPKQVFVNEGSRGIIPSRGVNVRPEVLIGEAQYATVGAKEDSAIILYSPKAQFAQPDISAEKIPGQTIIRFDEQICYQRY